MKLDEMESSISQMQQSNSILNNIDQNEQNEPVKVHAESNLKVTTSASGNSSEELEIALRQSTRRIKELEEKLVTGHRQGKAKVRMSFSQAKLADYFNQPSHLNYRGRLLKLKDLQN